MTPKMRRRAVVLAVAVLLVGVAGGLVCQLADRAPTSADRGPAVTEQIAQAGARWPGTELPAVARFVGAHWRGEQRPPPRVLQVHNEGVYVAARAAGQRMGQAWGLGDSAGAALARALGKVRENLGAQGRRVDRLEIFVAIRAEAVDAVDQKKRLLANVHRGVVGLEIADGKRTRRYSPTYVLASNLTHRKVIEGYGKQLGLAQGALWRLRYRFLSGRQFLVQLGPPVRARQMERGNRYVPLAALNRDSVADFAQRMAGWMWRNLHADGRMTYMYLPSQGREAPKRNNLIRQFMASIALGRVAAARNDPALWERSAANIDYNLGQFYRREGDLGLVELRGKVKLGAMALATLAIVEHRNRGRWSSQERALRNSVEALWQPDGSFRTFYRPAERNDNQNFYPGEALLLAATLYAQRPNRALLARIMRSFRYYRSYHLDAAVPHRRNPAFVPWHTQAYFKVWGLTRNEELRDFIFEMNDWLLAMQQRDHLKYRDTRGRFYDPQRPFGPPHASSTGVYLEGLIDAYRLARLVADHERAKRYGEAIRHGLRSAMQLQFADDVDMFYARNRAAVRGGLRTRVYDNQIRCDNVQHTLMGTLKILDSDVLNEISK